MSQAAEGKTNLRIFRRTSERTSVKRAESEMEEF